MSQVDGRSSPMSAVAARQHLDGIFPFPGYLEQPDALVDVGETVAKFLPAGGRILDFGCGPADKTAILALMGYRCAGADDLNDEWHLKPGARDAILNFAAGLGIEYHLLGESGLPDGPYDMVMLHHVLEHLHNSPRQLLLNLLDRTAVDGLLFITVPNHANVRKRIDLLRGKTAHNPYAMYYWYPDPWRGHVREYTKGDCLMLAKYLDLDVLELRGAHHMLQKVPARLRPAYLQISKLAPGMRDTWSMVARKRPEWNPPRELTDSEFRQTTGLRGWSTGQDHES